MRIVVGLHIGDLPSVAIIRDGLTDVVVAEDRVVKHGDCFGFPSRALPIALRNAGLHFADVDELVVADTAFPMDCLSDVKLAIPNAQHEHYANTPPMAAIDVGALAAKLGMTKATGQCVSRQDALFAAFSLIETKENALALLDDALGDGDLCMRFSPTPNTTPQTISCTVGLKAILSCMRYFGKLSPQASDYRTCNNINANQRTREENPYFSHLFYDTSVQRVLSVDPQALHIQIGDDAGVVLPEGLAAALDSMNREHVIACSLAFLADTIALALDAHPGVNGVLAGRGALFSAFADVFAQRGWRVLDELQTSYLPVGIVRATGEPVALPKSKNIGPNVPAMDALLEVFPNARRLQDTPKEVATLLAKGAVVAVFSGRSSFVNAEYGSRSILAPLSAAERMRSWWENGAGQSLEETRSTKSFGPFVDSTTTAPQITTSPSFQHRMLGTETAPDYVKILEALPDKSAIHINLARFATKAGSALSDAIECLELGVADYFVFGDLLIEVPAERIAAGPQLWRAIHAFERDADEEALAELEHLLTAHPDAVLPNYYLGNMQYVAKRYYESLQHFSRAIMANKLYTPSYLSAVNLLLTLQYNKEALSTAQLYVTYSNNDPDALFQKAIAYKTANMLQDAYRVLEQAVDGACYEKRYTELLAAWRAVLRPVYVAQKFPRILLVEANRDGVDMDLTSFNHILAQIPDSEKIKIVFSSYDNVLDANNLDLLVNDAKAKKQGHLCEVVVRAAHVREAGDVLDKLQYCDLDIMTIAFNALPSDEQEMWLANIAKGLAQQGTTKLEVVLASSTEDDPDFMETRKRLFNQFPTILSGDSLKSGLEDMVEGAQTTVHPCVAPFYTLAVTATGQYQVCWQVLRDSPLYLGSTFSRALIDVWHSAELNAVREQHVCQKSGPLTACGSCTHRRKFPRHLLESADAPYPALSLDELKQLAEAYHGKELFKETIDLLRIISSQEPTYANCYFDMGDLYAKLKDYDNAIAVFEQGLKHDPAAIDIYFRLSEMYMQRNDTVKAREYLMLAKERFK